MSGLDVLLRST